jgi:glucosamine--fructose-6-phosphate aminotransferase (isomerizing)
VNSGPGRYTSAEILSQPETWEKCLRELKETNQLQKLSCALPSGVEWLFIGCGSSFYVAQVAAATWSLLTGENARAAPASEVLLFPKTLPARCQPVLISRSGRTSEAVEAANYLERQLGLRTLAITCESGTPIEEASAYVIRLLAADEKSNVMTRSFSSMLLVLQALAAVRAGREDFLDALLRLPEKAQKWLAKARAAAENAMNSQDFADYVFLGQGPLYGIAQEATLKITEMSCVYAQPFHTLEFRHGPKAMVSSDTLLTFFLGESGLGAETAVVQEMKALGAKTLVIVNRADSAVTKAADFLIELGLDVPEAARAVVALFPGKWLALQTALRKGFNPDEPRNLTRVVMLDEEDGGGLKRGA